VPPAATLPEHGGGILGVVDQEVGVTGQIPNGVVAFQVARLVVGGVYDDSLIGLDPESQAALRMVEGTASTIAP
jgi:hypothetical protein